MPLLIQKLLTMVLTTLLSFLIGSVTGSTTIFFIVFTGGIITTWEFLDENFWPSAIKKAKELKQEAKNIFVHTFIKRR
jgi:hypothetical protein